MYLPTLHRWRNCAVQNQQAYSKWQSKLTQSEQQRSILSCIRLCLWPSCANAHVDNTVFEAVNHDFLMCQSMWQQPWRDDRGDMDDSFEWSWKSWSAREATWKILPWNNQPKEEIHKGLECEGQCDISHEEDFTYFKITFIFIYLLCTYFIRFTTKMWMQLNRQAWAQN